MAVLLGCENIRLEYPSKVLFESVTLGVMEGDRIGIVGCNGEGKSTLLKILAGELEPEGGRVTPRNGLRIALLGQTDALEGQATVAHEVVGDIPEYVWASDARIRAIFDHLLEGIMWDARIDELSGGQRRRVDLARLLIGDWDVLMLDEPTNHLDIRTITWLAHHLNTRWTKGNGALLLATHDRWFLDEVCSGMWEVGGGNVISFEGGFSAYVQARVEREQAAHVAEVKWRNMMRKELAWLSRGARARSSKPKFHLDAARALIADVPEMRDTLELKRLATSRLGKQVVDLDDVSVSYGDRAVLDHISWTVGPGDRFGILGENGAGKTSLLKVLCGALEPSAGRVKIGKTVRFATLSQGLDELEAQADRRVNEVLKQYRQSVVVEGKSLSPSQLLEKMGFDRSRLHAPVGSLSGGQRRRLQFLLILLDEPNVLILDEPGNDLDIDMITAMEDLLDAWPGTLFIVTHDRYLMERVSDQQFALIEGKLRHMPGGVEEYLESMHARGDASAAARRSAKAHGGRGEASSPEGGSSSRQLGNNEERQLKKRLETTQRKLDKQELRLVELHREMDETDPLDYLALMDKQRQIDEARQRKDELEALWLETAETLQL